MNNICPAIQIDRSKTTKWCHTLGTLTLLGGLAWLVVEVATNHFFTQTAIWGGSGLAMTGLLLNGGGFLNHRLLINRVKEEREKEVQRQNDAREALKGQILTVKGKLQNQIDELLKKAKNVEKMAAHENSIVAESEKILSQIKELSLIHNKWLHHNENQLILEELIPDSDESLRRSRIFPRFRRLGLDPPSEGRDCSQHPVHLKTLLKEMTTTLYKLRKLSRQFRLKIEERENFLNQDRTRLSYSDLHALEHAVEPFLQEDFSVCENRVLELSTLHEETVALLTEKLAALKKTTAAAEKEIRNEFETCGENLIKKVNSLVSSKAKNKILVRSKRQVLLRAKRIQQMKKENKSIIQLKTKRDRLENEANYYLETIQREIDALHGSSVPTMTKKIEEKTLIAKEKLRSRIKQIDSLLESLALSSSTEVREKMEELLTIKKEFETVVEDRNFDLILRRPRFLTLIQRASYLVSCLKDPS